MTLSKRLQQFRNSVRSLFSFDSEDIDALRHHWIEAAVAVFGLYLIGYGASRFHPGAGPLLVGAVLVLYVCPLSRLVK